MIFQKYIQSNLIYLDPDNVKIEFPGKKITYVVWFNHVLGKVRLRKMRLLIRKIVIWAPDKDLKKVYIF